MYTYYILHKQHNCLYSVLQVNFLEEDSPLSLSSSSALDGVKQEVQVVRTA